MKKIVAAPGSFRAALSLVFGLVTFAVGVATGIVMEFQFGTNWAAEM